jgi:hypothetical protein
LVTRPEEQLSNRIRWYCYGKFSAVGVVEFSVSARVAGGGRPTAVMRAVVLRKATPTEKPKENTVGQKKAKKLIVRRKTVAGWD